MATRVRPPFLLRELKALRRQPCSIKAQRQLVKLRGKSEHPRCNSDGHEKRKEKHPHAIACRLRNKVLPSPSLKTSTVEYLEKRIAPATIVGNSAIGSGGGLYLSPDGRDISVIKSTITGNTAGGSGGGIRMSSGGLLLKGGVLSGNTAGSGGGIYVQVLPGITSTITGTKILNNTATVSNGGGIQFDGSGSATATFNVLKSTLTGNSATIHGGGIAADNGGKLNLTGATLFANEATTRGGGVYTDGTAAQTVVLAITGSIFTDNTAARGGGIFTSGDGAVTLAKTKLITNHATSSFGGGAYLRSTNLITITSSLLTKNSADGSGGGAYVISDSSIILTGSSLTDNVSGFNGGGALLNSASTTITKTLVRGNNAVVSGGGLALALVNTTTTIVKSTITGNIARVSSGGIHSFFGTITVDTATKLLGNVAAGSPDKNF